MWAAVEPPVRAEPVTITREPRLVERVVFAGGLPGCGKTMLTPIIGSLARVELQRFNEPLEHVCGLRLLGAIREDVATMQIRMLTDLDLYKQMMSREVNLRPTDLTSICRNPGTWRYLQRIVQPGDAAAVARIQQDHPILHITMHNALAISPPLFAALGEVARIIEVVRHPLYMLKQWRAYIERYGTDVREFTLWFDHEGQALPFWARGWERQYADANPMDRTIYAIDHLLAQGREALAGLPPAQQRHVLTVPFEPFVLDPQPWLRRMEALLGTTVTPATRREMKRQRVPRRRIADGIARKIYKQYGWEPARRDASERAELDRRREFAAKEAGSEALAALDRLSAEYETTHLKDLPAWQP